MRSDGLTDTNDGAAWEPLFDRKNRVPLRRGTAVSSIYDGHTTLQPTWSSGNAASTPFTS
jgi:hypothetical protein